MGRRQQGGYRDPGTAQPASGPGAASSRTDAQRIDAPPLDSTDIQSGDVQRLENAQRAVPVPRQAPPATGSPPQGPAPSLPDLTTLRGGGGLPPYLFDMPSARPNEPGTARPAQMPDPDEPRLQDLAYLVDEYSNPDAMRILNEMQNQNAPDPALPRAPMPTAPALAPPGPSQDVVPSEASPEGQTDPLASPPPDSTGGTGGV